MRAFALVLTIVGAACATQAASRSTPADLFITHDCCGRLAHSQITKVGEIRSGGRTFAIYSLWYVNPQSRHGMKRLAVVEGRRFRGSYIISSWATPELEGNVVKFICSKSDPCAGDNFTIADGKIPSRLWVDGEINQLEDTI